MTRNIVLGLLASLVGTVAFAEGDPTAGQRVFNKCKSCHQIGEDAQNRVGPQLNQIIGRQPRTLEDFRYSDDMIALGESGEIWNEDTLTQFLTKPRDFVAGTTMSFPGLRRPEDIENLLAYLTSLE